MIGDHIRARKGGRWTHAIDCGDQTVIFLREDAAVPLGARVARSYRPAFVSGAESVEVVTHRERVFSPRQVVARAYSRTRDPALAAMFGNSEAFAEWCKTGRVLNGAYNYALSVPGVPAARARARGPNGAKAAAPKAAPKAAAAGAKASAAKASAAKAKPAARPKARAALKAKQPKASARAAPKAKPAAAARKPVQLAAKKRKAHAKASARGAARSPAKKAARKPAAARKAAKTKRR